MISFEIWTKRQHGLRRKKHSSVVSIRKEEKIGIFGFGAFNMLVVSRDIIAQRC